MDKHVFPVYRKLVGGGHYYRIRGEDRFDELQRVGDRWLLHEVSAKAYPERLRVHEMLAPLPPFERSDEAEWIRVLARVVAR